MLDAKDKMYFKIFQTIGIFKGEHLSGVDFVLLSGTIVTERVIQTQLLARQVHLSFHFKWLIVTGVGYRMCATSYFKYLSQEKIKL